ncbi:lysozyme inhibitor LprI family protein, partial [Ramlibacter alkalitolerans]
MPPREQRPAAAAPAERAPQARRTQPSFDCARARSAAEKLICADEDLARQDRELGQLHQRARQAAADPRAFQRESDAQWQQREDTCRDRECLQRWYAQRRAALAAAAATPSRPSRTERAAAPERAERTRPTERA